jgi:hypothetical protein
MKALCIYVGILSLIFGCSRQDFEQDSQTESNFEAPLNYGEPGRTVYTTTSPWRWDRTGYIRTTIHTAWNNSGTSVEATVDADEVVVGGGAALASDTTTSFLTGSYPVIGVNSQGNLAAIGWRAEAREINGGKTPRIIAYAVGMRLKDRYKRFSGNVFIPKQEVEKYISLTMGLSDYAAHPMAAAYAPNGYNIISGGARVYNVIDPNITLANYLTGSYYKQTSSSEGCWIASSKDHLISAPAKVIAYAISIPRNDHTDRSIPIFGDIRVTYNYCAMGTANYWEKFVGPTIPNTWGWTGGFAGADRDWCLTGVGALTEYNDAGRMLMGCYPSPGGNNPWDMACAFDRDYGVPDTSILRVQRLSIEVDDNEE